MPKVIFKKMSLEDNISFIKDIFEEKDDELLSVHTYTMALFPELKSISDDMSLEEKNILIEKVVTDHYNKSLKFDNDIERYNNAWFKYNDIFFEKLIEFLNINWPKKHDIVEVTVGIIPVCPRYLDKFSFSVHDGIANEQLIETCAHELCHFLWFEKWKKLYPDCPREECESPSIAWQYSEAVVDPVLEASGIKKLFNSDNRFSYDSFYENYDNLMDVLVNIYQKNINIDNKIQEGFNYYKGMISKHK